MGNFNLVKYGIEEEDSDIRAHVSICGQCCYVFKTCDGVKAITEHEYRNVPTKTHGIVTARGFLVPPMEIIGCRCIDIPSHWIRHVNFIDSDSTSEKGNKAVLLVKGLLKKGLFPMDMEGIEIEDKAIQIRGVDLIVTLQQKIQVKCDMKGGDRPGCTGNLYIQTHECNPYHQY